MCLTGIIVSTLRSLSVPPCQTRRLWNQSEGASTKQTRLGWQPQPITHLRRVCSMFAPPHHVSTCLHCVSCALLEGTALPNTHVMEPIGRRSEEHTSELQSLMRISYAVFCLKNKKNLTRHISRMHTNNLFQSR